MTQPASNPYIVEVPRSPVPASWRGPRPWVRVADLEICEWTDDGWQRRSVDGSVWAGLTIRVGTACDPPDRFHSMVFEEDEQGAFDICEDCGWASELPTTAEVAAAEQRGEFWYELQCVEHEHLVAHSTSATSAAAWFGLKTRFRAFRLEPGSATGDATGPPTPFWLLTRPGIYDRGL